MLPEHKLYGPYVSKQDGRRRVVLVFNDGTKTTRSYAKYLYELHIGPVPEGLTVDHIDEIKDNDFIDNFQLLTRMENAAKAWLREDRQRQQYFKGICSECNSEFEKPLNHVKHNKKQSKAGPFCSRSCAGKYNARNQYAGVSQLAEEVVLKTIQCEFESHRPHQPYLFDVSKYV